jgi:hypothetical protein
MQNNWIFYRRAKARQIFRGYFAPRADTQTDIFFYVHIATGKEYYFFSRTENTVIIFHLVSIVKYNNMQVWPS